MDKETLFVTGIDTDAGKSYATGWLVKHLRACGRKVLTQKLVQTGNHDTSEDIMVHRAVAGDSVADEPWALTAPQIFSYPASPHLAARIDQRELDFAAIDNARKVLEQQCDTLLVEGAGGLMVPLTEDILTVDYIVSRGLDVVLVTNGKLGSISHTLLALEALRTRGLKLCYVLYNSYFDSSDEIIAKDARELLARYTERYFPEAEYLVVPAINV